MTGVLTGSSLGEEVEVVAKAQRRRFTVAYKRRMLQEAERCKQPGELGALLRREGLYSSHLAAWRAARARGELVGNRATRRLRARAERAEALVEVQKKLSALVKALDDDATIEGR